MLATPYSGKADGNPYQHLLYQNFDPAQAVVSGFKPWRMLLGRWDIWHLHWPESMFINIRHGPTHAALRIAKTWIYLKIARLRRIKVVWTVHNLSSHAGRFPKLERLWMHLFCRNLSAVICLSESAVPLLHARYPETKSKRTWVTPHGHYRDFYPDQIDRAAARRALEIDPDAEVVLFFGSVRPYKRVPDLVRCFGDCDHGGRVLVVAGKPSSPELRAEIEAMARAGNIDARFHWEFVPDDRVQLYFRAADLFVAPFADVLNSGSAILALSFDCPVLVPNKGAMAELRKTIGTGWVRTFDGSLSPDVLDKSIAWAGHAQGRAPLTELDWTDIAGTTVRAFLEIQTASQHKRNSGTQRMVENATPS